MVAPYLKEEFRSIGVMNLCGVSAYLEYNTIVQWSILEDLLDRLAPERSHGSLSQAGWSEEV
jgi:hypothetical protein